MSITEAQAREVIGEKWNEAWNVQVARQVQRVVNARPTQTELLDFLSDFEKRLSQTQDPLRLQLFLYWLEKQADQFAGRIVVGQVVRP